MHGHRASGLSTTERSALQLDRLSRAVASAHMPLVLLCMGVLLMDQRPRAVQVRHSFICQVCERLTFLCYGSSVGLLEYLESQCTRLRAHGLQVPPSDNSPICLKQQPAVTGLDPRAARSAKFGLGCCVDGVMVHAGRRCGARPGATLAAAPAGGRCCGCGLPGPCMACCCHGPLRPLAPASCREISHPGYARFSGMLSICNP